jgi:hypothetical protein
MSPYAAENMCYLPYHLPYIDALSSTAIVSFNYERKNNLKEIKINFLYFYT